MPADENLPVENVEENESTAVQEATENEPEPVEESGNEEEAPKSTTKRKPRYRELQSELRNMESKYDELSEAVKALYNHQAESGKSNQSSNEINEPSPAPDYSQQAWERTYRKKAQDFTQDLDELKNSDDKAERDLARDIQDILFNKKSNINAFLSPQTQTQLVMEGIEPQEVIEIEKVLEETDFSPSTPEVEVRRLKKILKNIRNPKKSEKKVKAPMNPIGKVSGQPKGAPAKRDYNFFLERFRGK